MAQLISLVIDEVYRICTETGGGAKHYRPGIEPEVDRAIDRHRDPSCTSRIPYWRDVVSELCATPASICWRSGRSVMRCPLSRT